MKTQEEVNQKVLDWVNRENKEKIDHLIKSEERRSVAQTLDPIEGMIKVWLGKTDDFFLQHREKEEIKELLKPSKVSVFDELVTKEDLPEDTYGMNVAITKLSAQAIKKGVFRKNVVDQLEERYASRSKEIWDDEIKLSKKERHQFRYRKFDEVKLYQYCRPFKGDYPTRIQCAKAIDFADEEFKKMEFALPEEIPFEKDFMTALEKHY